MRNLLISTVALSALACASADGGHTSTTGTRGTSGSGAATGDGSSLFPVTFDALKGTVKLHLPAPGPDGERARCLLVAGIETGLGANDVGLDRGQMGGARLVRFRSVGGKVLLEQLNTAYRAEAGGDLERAAAAQSFATSVLWGGEPESTNKDGSVVIDLTGFLVRDAHGIARTLKRSGQGNYSLDAGRSALDVERCRAFPDNLEFAAVLTFSSDEPGALARSTAPDGSSLTFVQRQGFLRLPDDEYVRRPFDPRMGAFAVRYLDYGVALDAPLAQQLAVRHRLTRDAATGVAKPLVYYVDRAAPEPVRTALIEGASWWAEAFAAAGFPGMFRVEVAPEGMDPLDTRNNVIQWVHRSTRGWSYGNAIVDPRTGEIIKAHVSLGSLRVRQDRILFEGLLGAEKTGSGAADDPIELALSRIRQLAAHEVGHTLGFSHNFAASTSERSSVMDYPAPRVKSNGRGGIDVSDVYGVGVGRWDTHAVRMLYMDVPAGATIEQFYENAHVQSLATGLLYLTDSDARSPGAAQPYANLWDDGADPVTALDEALEVRRIALLRFGRRNLAEGRPLAELEEVFVPLYLHHRYQVDAAVKMIGGVEYDHAMNAASGKAMRPVSLADQRRALEALIRAMKPNVLRVPASVRDELLPRPPGYGGSRETFERRAGAAFDWLGAAEVAARPIARGLFHPQRLLRVELQSRVAATPQAQRFDAAAFVMTIFGVFREGAMETEDVDSEERALNEVAYMVVVEEALRTYRANATSRPVRDGLRISLQGFTADRALGQGTGLGDLQAEVRAVLARPAPPETRSPVEASPDAPPGSPIGSRSGTPPGAFHGSSMGTTSACCEVQQVH